MPGILLFNDNDAMKAWELQQLHKKFDTWKRIKRDYDPRIKKMNEFRNHRKTKYYYNNEVKCIRRLTQKSFRKQFKRNMEHEEFYRPVPHDYRTYGWLSY